MYELIILLAYLYYYIIKVPLAISAVYSIKTTFQIKWAWPMGVPIE